MWGGARVGVDMGLSVRDHYNYFWHIIKYISTSTAIDSTLTSLLKHQKSVEMWIEMRHSELLQRYFMSI